MKVYTSRYSNPELRTGKYTVVGVSRGLPKFNLGYALAGSIKDFAPPGYLFNEYDRSIFTPKYFAYMDRIGIDRAKQMLSPYKIYGKNIVLCCYEDVRIQGEWCHRLVFAEWFAKKTGYKIEELQDHSPICGVKQSVVEQPTVQQLSLFDN